MLAQGGQHRMRVAFERFERYARADRERVAPGDHRFMIRHAASERTWLGRPATNVAATGLCPRR